MISSLLHLVGLRPRVYYTLTNFRGGGEQGPLGSPPPQYANGQPSNIMIIATFLFINDVMRFKRQSETPRGKIAREEVEGIFSMQWPVLYTEI